jgi:hypothetical protein
MDAGIGAGPDRSILRQGQHALGLLQSSGGCPRVVFKECDLASNPFAVRREVEL